MEQKRNPKLGKAGGASGRLPLAGSMCIALGYAGRYLYVPCAVILCCVALFMQIAF